jgi:hypothetical protein
MSHPHGSGAHGPPCRSILSLQGPSLEIGALQRYLETVQSDIIHCLGETEPHNMRSQASDVKFQGLNPSFTATPGAPRRHTFSPALVLTPI